MKPTLDELRIELAKDIIAYASVLIKMDCDDVLENQTLFIEMLNESGYRTVTGKEFTKMSFRNLFGRLNGREKESVVQEFLSGHRDTDVLGTMFQ